MRTNFPFPSFPIVVGCNDASIPSATATGPATGEAQQTPEGVRTDAAAQRRVVERVYEDQVIAIALREKEIKEDARRQDAGIDLDFDKSTQPKEIEIQDIVDQVKRDKAVADSNAELKGREPGAQAADIKADQLRRKAEIDLQGNEKTTAINDKIDHAKAIDLEKHQEVAKQLTQKLNDLKLEIIADERAERHQKIDIDYNATVMQDAMTHKSAEESEQVRQSELRKMDKDLKISQTLREDVIVDPSLSVSSKDVDISTSNGVVLISGLVPTEADHQKILSTARSIDGVMQVTDRIAVK
jgi:osmotically-inducible protein OsmY